MGRCRRPPLQAVAGLFLILLWSCARALTLEVEVTGVEGPERENVLAALGLAAARDEPRLTPARLRLLVRRAEREAARALEPFGYYDARVRVILEQPGEERWRARVEIDPGPPVRVASVLWRIKGPGAGDPLLERPFPLKKGAVLRHALWESFKREVLEQALAVGYLDARFGRHRILVDPEARSARLELVLETGPLYRFGEVTIDRSFLDPGLANRLVGPLAGERYRRRLLLAAQRALLDSGYFRSVSVRPLREQAEEERIPVEIRLEPRDGDRYRVGVGYATDEGPRLTLEWSRPLVNRHGHSAGLELRLSPVESSLSGRYRVPGGRPRTDYLTFESEFRYHDSQGRTGHTGALGVAHYSLRNGWQRLLGLEYSVERNELPDGGVERFHELVPGFQLTRRVQDNPLRTLHGHRLDFRVLGALEALLSSGSYLQGRAYAKWIHAFGRGERWRLVARGELGLTWTRSLGQLPASRRFYAGGDNSIRGYRFESVAPEDAVGNPVGGRHLAVAGLELDRFVTERWALALFVDGGGAWDPDHRGRSAAGAGAGLIWFSPIGPVRADLGVPLDGEGGVRLHVSVGPEL